MVNNPPKKGLIPPPTDFVDNFHCPGLFLVLFLHLQTTKGECPWHKTRILLIIDAPALTRCPNTHQQYTLAHWALHQPQIIY